MRVDGGVASRFLHVRGAPVIVRVWRTPDGRVALRAEAPPPRDGVEAAGSEVLELGLDRMRFALGIDEDFSDFYASVKRDRLIGPIVRRRPWVRPWRRPWPWEALAWAVTEQLIESDRAAAIQRRIVRRWGPRAGAAATALADVPAPEALAGAAPAELEAMDLSPARSIALVKVAREVAAGRAELSQPEPARRRLLSIPEIGPWTVQMLGLLGHGDADSLPAGDLAYLKLVGRLAGMPRRATVEEVEAFFEPYEPFRGLAGTFLLRGAGLIRAPLPAAVGS